MKNIVLPLVSAGLLASSSLLAEGKALVEAKFSYFYPQSSTIRDVYGDGGINYQFAFSYFVWKGLAVKASVDYFTKDGSSSDGTSTSIRIIPISLGPMYAYRTGIFSFYGGLGMRYFFAKIDNESIYVSNKSDGNGMGGYAEIGTLIRIASRVYVDVFADYGYKKLNLSSTPYPNVTTSSLQVGGLNVGAGIGFKF